MNFALKLADVSTHRRPAQATLLCRVAVAATHGIIYVYAEIYLATAIGLAYSYPIRIYLLNPALQSIILQV